MLWAPDLPASTYSMLGSQCPYTLFIQPWGLNQGLIDKRCLLSHPWPPFICLNNVYMWHEGSSFSESLIFPIVGCAVSDSGRSCSAYMWSASPATSGRRWAFCHHRQVPQFPPRIPGTVCWLHLSEHPHPAPTWTGKMHTFFSTLQWCLQRLFLGSGRLG